MSLLQTQYLLDLFKCSQPVDVIESNENLIRKVYGIVKQIENSANIQCVMKKHILQFERGGMCIHIKII